MQGAPRPAEKIEDAELEAFLDEDLCQTLEELVNFLNVNLSTVDKRLEEIGMIQTQESWVLHELKPRDVKKHFSTCEQLLQRHKRKRSKVRYIPGQPLPLTSALTPKQNIHGSKELQSKVKAGKLTFGNRTLWNQGR